MPNTTPLWPEDQYSGVNPLDHDRQAWDHQTWESLEAYNRFLTFRNLGPRRTVKPLAKEFKVSVQAALQQATKNGWRYRCHLYDKWLREEAARLTLERMVGWSERHALMLAEGEVKVYQRLKDLKPEEITAAMLPTYVQTFISQRRLYEGVNTGAQGGGNTTINTPKVLIMLPDNGRGDRVQQLKPQQQFPLPPPRYDPAQQVEIGGDRLPLGLQQDAQGHVTAIEGEYREVAQETRKEA